MQQTLLDLMIENPNVYDVMWKIASNIASCKVSPPHLRGDPNAAMLIVMKAHKWRLEPMDLANKTYSIKGGTIQYEAQAINAAINQVAPLIGNLKFETIGNWERVVGNYTSNGNSLSKGWAWADEKGLGVKVTGMLEGWKEPESIVHMLAQVRTRNSSNWIDDPVQQLIYLTSRKWARRHCPEVILGAYAPDEIDSGTPREMPAKEIPDPIDGEPVKKTQAEALVQSLNDRTETVGGSDSGKW